MLEYDDAATIAGTAQNDVAPRLVVKLKSSPFQGADDLARSESGQLRHYVGSRATLSRPTNCSSQGSTGIGSPCLTKLAQ